jgi:hypothetical protein
MGGPAFHHSPTMPSCAAQRTPFPQVWVYPWEKRHTPPTKPAATAAKKPAVTKQPAKLGQAKRPSPPTAAQTKPIPKPTPKPAAVKKKPQAPATGGTQEVTTASGVTIKIPKAKLDEAKNSGTTTMVTANGHTIQVAKKDIEEAQKKKGDIIKTSSGVSLKITPSGAATVEAPKAGASATPKYVFKPSTAPSPAKKAAGAGAASTGNPSGAATKKVNNAAPKKLTPPVQNKNSGPRKLNT